MNDNNEILMYLQRQDKRMESLEQRFNSLLASVDGHMSQLIVLLAEKQGRVPVKSLLAIIGIVTLSVCVALFGHEAVIAIISELKK